MMLAANPDYSRTNVSIGIGTGHAVTQGLGWALEQYVIVRPIASGRFGSVYLATHSASGRSVALKLIPRQGPDGDEKVAAERHGAMLQQRFCTAHRNLVPEVFEHGPMGGFYAIAMEFVDGQQLSDRIKAGPLPAEPAAAIALSICQFLEKAHQFKTTIEDVHYELIVHADLKPDHVLLLENGEIRVLDFGIAKALAARSLVTTNKWGSVQYASPERLQSDGRVDPHTDFWSLGVMLFEMLAKFRPYQRYEHSLSRLDRAIRTLETPEPLPRGTDPALAAIVRKLLATQIERRYGSATLIASDLAAYLRGERTIAETELARAAQDTIRVSDIDRSAAAQDGAVQARRAETAASATPVESPVKRRRFRLARVLWPRRTAQPVPPREAAPATSAVTPRAQRGPIAAVRRAARLALGGVLLVVVAAEGLGLVRAERMLERIDRIEPSDVSAARSQYYAIARTPLGLASLNLRGRLTDRMVELANRTILDFRTESPTVALRQWQLARDALDLARELAPGDNRIAAKHTYVTGQLTRIAGSMQADIDLAVRYFRESARLDPRSPDPYLGLARVAAYVTWDIEALQQAIAAAESRGYSPGRRERAQLGDVHKVLADRARVAASNLTGASRVEHLEQAAADYEQCVAHFEGLRYFNSEDNLIACRRRLEATRQEIERARPPLPWRRIPLFR
jgi:eukaryotic-like serine/threonine-protein kinase